MSWSQLRVPLKVDYMPWGQLKSTSEVLATCHEGNLRVPLKVDYMPWGQLKSTSEVLAVYENFKICPQNGNFYLFVSN